MARIAGGININISSENGAAAQRQRIMAKSMAA